MPFLKMDEAPSKAPPCATGQYEEILKEVSNLADFGQIRQWAKKHCVSTKNCLNIQQVKERLRYSVMKEHGLMKDLRAVEHLMEQVRDQDRHRRYQLSLKFKELESILQTIMTTTTLGAQLETEGVTTTDGYKATIEKFRRMLDDEHCPIVVAGETSSGKSSLLNLFMGEEEEVLPAKLLSCTSAACELLHGEYDGELIPREPNKRPESFDFKHRERYIYKKTDRHEAFKHIVRLRIPNPMLQSGVTLVDTPGLGENSDMKQVLLDYIEQNDVYGFIYVIKSDNAGGVAKDRLQSLLMHISQLKNEFGQKKVDPKSAIFICNRWDLVPEDQREVTEDNIIFKLRMCWPGFDPARQLFKMNTEFAWTTFKVGYITDDYSELIDGLQVLLPMGLQNKIKTAHWWLNKVLTRIYHPVRVYLNRLQQTDHQMKLIQKSVDAKAADIKKNCASFVKEFAEKLKNAVEQVSGPLLQYLLSPDALAGVESWTSDDIPTEEYGDSWIIMQTKIDDVIDARICNIIRTWEMKEQYLKRKQQELLRDVGEGSAALSNQIEELEKFVRTASFNGEGNSLCRELQEMPQAAPNLPTVSDELRNPEFFEDLKMMLAESFRLTGLKQELGLSHLLNVLRDAPTAFLGFRRKQQQKLAEKSFNLYKKDRVKHIAVNAVATLKSIQTEDMVKQLVKTQLETLESFVTEVKDNTPKLLKANQELLQMVLKDRRTKTVIANVYRPLESKTKQLLEKSAVFFCREIKEYDIEMEEIALDDSFNSVAGLFSFFKAGHLKRKSQVCHSIYRTNMRHLLKFSTEKMTSRQNMHEEEMIRAFTKSTLREYVPKILAVMKNDALPTLIFERGLLPARLMYCSRRSQAEKIAKHQHLRQCRQFVESLSEALSWIHTKRLVHMELSLDSVLVDSSFRVKLSNLGEPRTLDIDQTRFEQAAGSYVYLPCYVLEGERYTYAADIYSLGILIWEVWHNQEVFIEEKKKQLLEFVSLSDPCKVLLKNGSEQESSPKIAEVVKKCMELKSKSMNLATFNELWKGVSIPPVSGFSETAV